MMLLMLMMIGIMRMKICDRWFWQWTSETGQVATEHIQHAPAVLPHEIANSIGVTIYIYIYSIFVSLHYLSANTWRNIPSNWWGSQFEQWRLDKEWLWSSMIVPRPVIRRVSRPRVCKNASFEIHLWRHVIMCHIFWYLVTTGSKYMSTLFITRLIIPTVP